MSKEKNELIIKVPVFLSDRLEREKDIFNGITYKEFIDNAKSKIEQYNTTDISVSSDRRNKTMKKEIGKIDVFENQFNDIPFLLLKISAFNTNLEGCVITENETHQLENNDKIGSENNYIMLYPKIIGEDKQTIYWIILVYDDPKKDSHEIISTAKLVLTKILNQPIKSIKLPSVLEELRRDKILPQIKMQLNSISFNENILEPKYEQYKTSSRIIRKEEYDLNNMPLNEI